MYRFFEQKDAFAENGLILNNENTHHILNVLRMREDELFEVVIDGQVYLTRIKDKIDKSLSVDIVELYEDKKWNIQRISFTFFK